MSKGKEEILLYTLVGAGYLLVCSGLPTLLAAQLSAVLGGDVNLYYAGLSLAAGALFVKLLFQRTGESMELREGICLAGAAEAVGTALLLFVLINFIVSPVLFQFFPVSAGNYEATVTGMLEVPMAALWQVMVIAPLWEELIFRGFILKRALRRWSSVFSILLTSVLFGILHMSVVQGLSAAAAGLLLCHFYVRRRSVGLNILAHSLYNGMVFFYFIGRSLLH